MVTCVDAGGDEGDAAGAKYILAAICCYSKWPWLVPIKDKTAEIVGRALLERVLIGMAMFPSVIRSDNDPSFLSVHGQNGEHKAYHRIHLSPTVAGSC